MTTANYQFTNVWLALSILSTCTLSVEFVLYDNMLDQNYAKAKKVPLQQDAIALAGGIINYQNTNIVNSSLSGEYPYVEFASDKTGNGLLLTRYHSKDMRERDAWDYRIMRAKLFKPYNENQDHSPKQDMISNNLHSYGLLLYTNEEKVNHGSFYIMSVYYTGGVRFLEEMLANHEGFVTYMSNPYHRILFYLDLVRIWKEMAVEL